MNQWMRTASMWETSVSSILQLASTINLIITEHTLSTVSPEHLDRFSLTSSLAWQSSPGAYLYFKLDCWGSELKKVKWSIRFPFSTRSLTTEDVLELHFWCLYTSVFTQRASHSVRGRPGPALETKNNLRQAVRQQIKHNWERLQG